MHNKSMYSRLAFNNINKNKEIYGPFILVAITMVSLFYMISCLNQQVENVHAIKQILNLSNYCIIFFIVIILFYINSFLMKYRTREFGLYNILGMDKPHIGKVLFWEIGIIGLTSIVIGLFFGMLFSKFIFLVFINLTGFEGKKAFFLSKEAAIVTVILFICLLTVIIIYNKIRIAYLNPVELINSSKVGEKEPKGKPIIAILGFVFLGTGYYLASTCEQIIKAMPTFCKAVLLVMIGTYLIFISGSIIVLKLLKKNKRFYYNKTNFIMISGMIYRMRKNAVGLASICILSTMVLVSLTTTISLYAGINNQIKAKYDDSEVISEFIYEPKEDKKQESNIDSDDIDLIGKITEEAAKKYNVSVKNQWGYYFLRLRMEHNASEFTYSSYVSDDLYNLDFITIEDYNKKAKTKESLLEGEAMLIYPKNQEYKYDSINVKSIKEKRYKIKKKIKHDNLGGLPLEDYGYLQRMVVVVPNLQHIVDLTYFMKDEYKNLEEKLPVYKYRYNLEGKYEDKVNLCNNLKLLLTKAGIVNVGFVDNIYSYKKSNIEVYGNFLFIGIFFGVIFLISTVIILYYKQISEGYEDKTQFSLMKKVGMDNGEVKKIIKRQVIMVFFLPISLSILHLCFALNVIKQILFLLGLTNMKLIIMCTIATVLAFIMVYGISYTLTSKVYYRMINRKVI